jgi:ArsR family transcriptional regulator
MTPEGFKQRAQIGKALSHPARLLIIAILLDEGDQCVSDLVKRVGSDQSTVSKHLSVLKNVGIIDDRREGSRVIYHLRTPCVKKFFECVSGVCEAQRQRINGET